MPDTHRENLTKLAARDPDCEGLVTDRAGVEKLSTFSGTSDPTDRFCELCLYANSARFISEFEGGTAVCTTHARALENGSWDYGETHEITPLEEAES